jgi:hypothetical protein
MKTEEKEVIENEVKELVEVKKDAEIRSYNVDALELVKGANELALTTHGDLETASAKLSEIAKLKKQIVAKREKFTDPLVKSRALALESKRAIEAEFEIYLEPVLEADGIIRKKYLVCKRAIDDAARKEDLRLAKIEENRRKKEEIKEAEAEEKHEEYTRKTVTQVVPISTKQPAQKSVGKSTTIKVPKWKILNVNDIPREYFLLNEKKVNALVKGGIQSIPGIHIWEEDDLRVRADA